MNANFSTTVTRQHEQVAFSARPELSVAKLDIQRPPGNRLQALQGKRKGQHSIRINDQWPICFRWDQTARMMSKSYLVISMTFLGSNIFKGIITKTVKAKSSIEGGRNRNDGELLAPRPC